MMDMLQGTPRDLVVPTGQPVKNGVTVRIQTKNDVNEILALGSLLPLNCLLGPEDRLPGLDELKHKELPNSLTQLQEVTYAKTVNFFVHQIKVTAIDEIEKAFN